jgi:flagellar hook-basal body complex protein FliE
MTSPLVSATAGLPVPNIGGEGTIGKASTEKETRGVPFADLLQGAVASANARAQAADAATQAFAAGAVDDIHGTMIAVKQADIELKLVANVRNKLVDAFNDLWRMNI